MFCDSSHWVGDFPSPRPRPILWCGLWNNLRPCDTLAARNIGYINIVGLSLFCLCGKSQLNLLSQYLTMFPVYMIFPMMLLILSIGNGNGHKEECPLWFDCGQWLFGFWGSCGFATNLFAELFIRYSERALHSQEQRLSGYHM